MVADLDDSTGQDTVAALGAEVGDAAPARSSHRRDRPGVGRSLRGGDRRALRPLDVLVNNAALYGDWDMRDQRYDYLLRMMEVNLHGVG